jgi:hypothetical protein
MPSLAGLPERHVVIDRRPGQYLSFPDVCLTRDGRLLCAYQQSDRHVAARRALLLSESADLGATWSAPRTLHPERGHCPRFTMLPDGELLILEDHGKLVYRSQDQGRTFTPHPFSGFVDSMADRAVPLGGDRLFTTGHTHRGTHPHPFTRQPTTEQMGYLSEDLGRSWRPLSAVAHEKNLVLCEASVVSLPDGRLLGLLRENTGVFEPMYQVRSQDEGRTWSDPAPTPLLGHRPCLGFTRSGELLVTYRNVSPAGGTAAWMGRLEELDEFRVHGLAQHPHNPRLEARGLVLETRQGFGQVGRPGDAALFALRPLTDPDRARASLRARVKATRGGDNACGLHLGVWWRIHPDRIVPAVGNPPQVPLAPGRFHDLRLEYRPGAVTLYVDGQRKARVQVAPSAAARRILWGTVPGVGGQAGRSVWRSLSLETREPRYSRTYRWSWEPSSGLPDAWARSRVLELAPGLGANPGDYGYSGWVELPDGRFFCAYHHADATLPGYREGEVSHIQGTWFTAADFSPLA